MKSSARGSGFVEANERIAACLESRSHSLSLGYLQLTELPDKLVSLTGLTSLSLSNNEIGEAGARAIAERLTGLTSLNLDDNGIGEAGARAIAERLTGLTSLNLDDNG